MALDDHDHPHLVAIATNASDEPIKSAKLCVRIATDPEKCLFTFWNKQEWGAGKNINVDVESRTKVTTTVHQVTLESIGQNGPASTRSQPITERGLAASGGGRATSPTPSRFAGVTRIYVEPIDGTGGQMARQHLMAGLANTERFQAVDNPELADAFVRGMSNEEFDLTRTDTSGKGGVLALGAVGAGDRAGAASGVGFAAGKSSSVTQQIKSQTAAFRLVTRAGIIVWGWDDSKPCGTQRTKCAIDDLVWAASSR